ncbi:MAG: glycoside hydrolase family 27 protein [Butyrivibrio sp.]|nr:glycoside hydrolase family 27 protein [Butyrivibrio sp.]
MQNTSTEHPDRIPDIEYRYDSFDNGKVLHDKKKGHLPAMGWNSWNAFGSGNTELLTKAMADKIIELGLDKLGYKYLVLDDGCYKEERVGGRLLSEEGKFPSGFKALADYIHDRGLKFGMYNDIGTNLCAGAYVGTCGHEKEDAASYADWDVDFLKVDNCYYLWDNATFSDAANAKYVFAPAIGQVKICFEGDKETTADKSKQDITFADEQIFTPGVNMTTEGDGFKTKTIEDKVFFTDIGTFDGTGPARTPYGCQSGEVSFGFNAKESGNYRFTIENIKGKEEGLGSWLQIAANNSDKGGETIYLFDGLLEGSEDGAISEDEFVFFLEEGRYTIRLMNHRRQENTLFSYAKLLEGLKEAKKDHDIIFSLCEWGKTQPQNWGKKVGDSWRILNDITFSVGADGDPGNAAWINDYTCSVTSQYNKAVIMDSFAGLDKGWNDPDMLVVGMNGLSLTQQRTHMTMWCMMNSPLMLGLDLRRVSKGDDLYEIIANKKAIDLNQDSLGIQAKRVFCSLLDKDFDTEYVTSNDRVDILAKPLSDGSIALSFINLSADKMDEGYSVSVKKVASLFEGRAELTAIKNASAYRLENIWTGEESRVSGDEVRISELEPYDQVTLKVFPL